MDVSKGIGILLMVLGHTSIPSALSKFIWAFHMPLFFIASGWTTNWQKTDFITFTKRKLRTLLLPFFGIH
ncbi:acyltransferase family protein [Flammeovirga sp. MY04]|nr:acyltransferase family protein [Flammeovirga sp. MY04]